MYLVLQYFKLLFNITTQLNKAIREKWGKKTKLNLKKQGNRKINTEIRK